MRLMTALAFAALALLISGTAGAATVTGTAWRYGSLCDDQDRPASVLNAGETAAWCPGASTDQSAALSFPFGAFCQHVADGDGSSVQRFGAFEPTVITWDAPGGIPCDFSTIGPCNNFWVSAAEIAVFAETISNADHKTVCTAPAR